MGTTFPSPRQEYSSSHTLRLGIEVCCLRVPQRQQELRHDERVACHQPGVSLLIKSLPMKQNGRRVHSSFQFTRSTAWRRACKASGGLIACTPAFEQGPGVDWPKKVAHFIETACPCRQPVRTQPLCLPAWDAKRYCLNVVYSG